MIVASMHEDGFGRSGLLDKHGNVIAGNKTLEASAEVFGVDADVIVVESDGTKPVYVQRTDLDLDTDVAARRIAYRDNLTSHFSFDLDPDIVLADIGAGFDFPALGVTMPDLSALGVDVGGNGKEPGPPPIDKAAELREKWGTELGQLWQLGAHRLICGDCTDRAVVEKVMGGERARLTCTDPPYGVKYGDKLNDTNPIPHRVRVIENDDLKPDELEVLLHKAFTIASESSVPGGVLYAACPPGTPLPTAIAAIEGSGFTFHWQLVWVKDQLVLGRGDYHFRHENVLYGWKHDAAHYFINDRKQDSVFEVPRPKISNEHPTMKPVELIAQLVANSSEIGEVVLDPFLGSGTTLIACENLSRKCRAVELDPGYVAVTLQRYADHTNQTPELIATL
jgi:DNA modification methylase